MEPKDDTHVRPDKVSFVERLRREEEEERKRREQQGETEEDKDDRKPANPTGVRTK